jgi:hypothetical protein
MIKIKSKLSVLLSVMILSSMLSLTGCKNDDVVETNNSQLGGELSLSKSAVHMDRSDLFLSNSTSEGGSVNSNTSVQKEEKDDRVYDTKAELTELIMEGSDDTTYFEIKGDDIIYDGVTYLGLNKIIEEFPHPYDNTSVINFIVKTYEPMGKRVLVTGNLGDENGYVSGWSMGISDDLEMNWDGYSVILEKYGTKARWLISLCDSETYDRKTTLCGNKDYIIFLGAEGDTAIDMNELAKIKPEN